MDDIERKIYIDLEFAKLGLLMLEVEKEKLESDPKVIKYIETLKNIEKETLNKKTCEKDLNRIRHVKKLIQK